MSGLPMVAVNRFGWRGIIKCTSKRTYFYLLNIYHLIFSVFRCLSSKFHVI